MAPLPGMMEVHSALNRHRGDIGVAAVPENDGLISQTERARGDGE